MLTLVENFFQLKMAILQGNTAWKLGDSTPEVTAELQLALAGEQKAASIRSLAGTMKMGLV